MHVTRCRCCVVSFVCHDRFPGPTLLPPKLSFLALGVLAGRRTRRSTVSDEQEEDLFRTGLPRRSPATHISNLSGHFRGLGDQKPVRPKTFPTHFANHSWPGLCHQRKKAAPQSCSQTRCGGNSFASSSLSPSLLSSLISRSLFFLRSPLFLNLPFSSFLLAGETFTGLSDSVLLPPTFLLTLRCPCPSWRFTGGERRERTERENGEGERRGRTERENGEGER